MKLSKQQETKIIKAYKVYFDSYINGDLKTIVSLLDDDYNQIGSAETEVFFNKEDAIKFLHDTIDQVAGKTEMRNRFLKLDPLDEYILVTDLFDIYALMETEWSFYAKFRASTLMQKKDNGWKFIHQHSSMPDTRTEEGENIAIEKVNAENLQLREAVKRRTVELEAKNNELKIESSLERIRTIAMSMQKAEGLLDVLEILSTELKTLGFTDIRNTIINIFNDTEEKFLNYDYSDYGVGGISEVDYNSHPSNIELVNKMREASEEFMITEFTGNELDEWRKWRIDQGQMPDPKLDKAKSLYYYEFSIGVGSIGISTFSPINADQLKILNKIRNVFDLAYRRYADIAQAEAHAREAKIEAALERVRSRSMAMHTSEELADTASILFEQLNALGELPDRVGICIINEEQKVFEQWVTNQEGKYLGHRIIASIEEPTSMMKLYNGWKEKKDHLIIDLQDHELKKWMKFVREDLKMVVDDTNIKGRRIHNGVFFSNGMFLCTTHHPVSKEIIQLLIRFVKVFEQAYTRFLDLQKAEAQAREAQIEAALEWVRSKTMAMHNSEDMGNTVLTLFHEVLKLGLDNDIRCGIGILEGSKRMETRSATLDPNGEVDLKIGMLDMTIHPMLIRIKKAWKSGGTRYTDQMTGQDVIRYYTALNNEPDYPFFVELDTLPKTEFHNSFSFSEGILFAFSPNLMSEETAKVLDRFARVFGQTYRRFRDLQKAEEQTREAKIEASLERIRSQAMAMQHSDDLIKSTSILFEELEKLELPLERCGIGIFDKETRDCQLYTTVVNDEGKTELATGITSLTVHPMLIKTFDAWEVQESLLYALEGKELEDYYKLVSKSKFHLPEDVINKSASLVKEYYYYTPFGAGGLYVFSDIEPTNEEIKVIRRFAEVFHMTYTRYEDLQKAEARALEAVKQASLDRVRAEIASMRTTEDLQRITPLIWSELEILEVPFIRCGVFIIDESRTNVQVYLTTPDGKPLGVLNLPFDANELTSNMVEYWRKKKVYTQHWNKEDFIKWMESMISMGQIQTREEYQGDTKPPESLDLHFIPFMQGMLYVGNSEPLLPEKIELVKTLAEDFSIAYARYEDFIHLEEAKNQIENALTELKSAQGQLIHAEKMASLGELTAGIAHEIQNPLNFVNNFSDVSVDLIEEMDEEMASGNTEEVKAIAGDLKQNLEKITLHGKRASFIVRGMLEHSRTNTGDKKPTDINILADEFLRLSYHGLRAKDKSFNAEFKTEFDEDLPKINVIPQDFGRVLLNLVNNAFYAVAEKQKQQPENYNPLVVISTNIKEGKLEIKVRDNGNGIPNEVKEKIFQPFFTTKPTGEGTGLGLSLSYDIITKGHNGKLTVNTKEGEGTEFIIVLPEK